MRDFFTDDLRQPRPAEGGPYAAAARTRGFRIYAARLTAAAAPKSAVPARTMAISSETGPYSGSRDTTTAGVESCADAPSLGGRVSAARGLATHNTSASILTVCCIPRHIASSSPSSDVPQPYRLEAAGSCARRGTTRNRANSGANFVAHNRVLRVRDSSAELAESVHGGRRPS